MRRDRENTAIGICHFLNAIPLWGLLFCGWIWFHHREQSRRVVANAERAMTFHVLLLSASLIAVVVWIVGRVLSHLSVSLGNLLLTLNLLVLEGVILLHVVICLWGAWRSFNDHPFRYPLIEKRSKGGDDGQTS